jgi:hypothetical protein
MKTLINNKEIVIVGKVVTLTASDKAKLAKLENVGYTVKIVVLA